MKLSRFNASSEQRKLNRKTNLASNIRVRTIVLSIFVLVGSIMLFTYSSFSKTIKLDIMHAKVANFIQDDYIINAYVNGEEDDFPGKDDGYYVDEVVCNKGATGTWDDDEWGLLITGATEEETECNVYFKTFVTEFNFEFDPDGDGIGQVQTLRVPVDGTYKLEVWGAQGGSKTNSGKTGHNTIKGGYGGYSIGNIEANKGEILYIFVGEEGVSNIYNILDTDIIYSYPNGGAIPKGGSTHQIQENGGGGSTHIAKDNKLIEEYASNDSNLLIIAGGGGGVSNFWEKGSNGGSGGGYIGGSTTSNYDNINATGGTQSAGGSGGGNSDGHSTTGTWLAGNYGIGGGKLTWGSSSASSVSGGGGGGYYGGGASWGGSGAGGSGYIASSNLKSSNGITKHMYCYNCTTNTNTNTNTQSNGTSSCHNPTATPDCAKEGNGYARITLIERN